MSGLFITFEGADGVGKTTHLGLLADWLTAKGHEVVVTREPGGTKLGKHLRQLLLHGNSQTGENLGEITPRAEALLYAADRAQHIAELVQPALKRGAIVLQDRYIDSSVAYQGAGRVLDTADIRRISEWATGGLTPHLTLLLDIPRQVAAERMIERGGTLDRLEAEGAEFREAVRQQFLTIAEAEPARVRVINAAASVNEVQQHVRDALTPLL